MDSLGWTHSTCSSRPGMKASELGLSLARVVPTGACIDDPVLMSGPKSV